MSRLQHFLIHDITIWEMDGTDVYGVTYAAPRASRGRWEEKATNYRDVNGDEKVSQSAVLLDEFVDVGTYIAWGTFADTDPRTVVSAKEVIGLKNIPNLRGTSTSRKALF